MWLLFYLEKPHYRVMHEKPSRVETRARTHNFSHHIWVTSQIGFQARAPPLFLALLFLHLHVIISIWWTRITWARLPCKFGLVTPHVVIQLAMRLTMLLEANLKTSLVSILSLCVANHGKYSIRVKIDNYRAFLTALRRTNYYIQDRV